MDAAPPDGVELYFYWRTPPAALAQALATVAAFQRGMEQAHPGLAARLLQRVDAPAAGAGAAGEATAPATVMEIYRRPGPGIDPATERLLRDGGDAATAAQRLGARHCERFVPAAAG